LHKWLSSIFIWIKKTARKREREREREKQKQRKLEIYIYWFRYTLLLFSLLRRLLVCLFFPFSFLLFFISFASSITFNFKNIRWESTRVRSLFLFALTTYEYSLLALRTSNPKITTYYYFFSHENTVQNERWTVFFFFSHQPLHLIMHS